MNAAATERAAAFFIATTDENEQLRIANSIPTHEIHDFTWDLFMNGYDHDAQAPASVQKVIEDKIKGYADLKKK